MPQQPQFLWITCQVGAERAVKHELARRWPDFHPAFARPGLLTFKLPDEVELPADFELDSIFARAFGFSLGKVTGATVEDRAREAWKVLGDRPVGWIHAWERDRAAPGDHGFEPSITPEADEAFEALRRTWPREEMGTGTLPQSSSAVRPGLGSEPVPISSAGNQRTEPARVGDWVLDCILVDPGVWWIGRHRALSLPSRWPGGILPIQLPADAVSRAWLKMEEALEWSQLPVTPGARWAEIGAAPGGASQALLARGFEVVGIDPAEIHPTVLAHPRFRHVRRRSVAVPKREFRKVRWLTVDMNVAPSYTLDTIESIVTHAEVNIRGMLLTLKLPEWDLADRAPEFLARVRSWGYNAIQARQLLHNRQEFCVAAVQRPFRRKPLRTARRRG